MKRELVASQGTQCAEVALSEVLAITSRLRRAREDSNL